MRISTDTARSLTTLYQGCSNFFMPPVSRNSFPTGRTHATNLEYATKKDENRLCLHICVDPTSNQSFCITKICNSSMKFRCRPQNVVHGNTSPFVTQCDGCGCIEEAMTSNLGWMVINTALTRWEVYSSDSFERHLFFT